MCQKITCENSNVVEPMYFSMSSVSIYLKLSKRINPCNVEKKNLANGKKKKKKKKKK